MALCAVQLLEDKWNVILKRTRSYLAACAGNPKIKEPDDVQGGQDSSSEEEEPAANAPEQQAEHQAEEGEQEEKDLHRWMWRRSYQHRHCLDH